MAEGFRCGIEIHQQLETHKLFCSCPSIVHDKSPDIRFQRMLRAVAGETGMVDAAAMYEKKKGMSFIYEACSTSSCLVEMDEEPPHEMNREALGIALQTARLLNARVVDEIQVMRKTVVDGSNVSGFQRTALIAMDGFIETSKGKVSIPLICLEEEAAKKVKADDTTVTYRLDRLGVPLLEVSTDASIKDPEHAKECAQKIGMILRSTGKVKRGIGTIRQDVNISIKGGARTEIKGFQDLKSIPEVIEKEIQRQEKLIKAGKAVEPGVRKAEPDGSTSFLRPMPGSARMYPETDIIPIRPSAEEGDAIEMIEDKMTRFHQEYGLSMDLAQKIAKSGSVGVFEAIIEKLKDIKPAFAAEMLISAPREIRRKHDREVAISSDGWLELFTFLSEGKIPKDSFLEAVLSYDQGTFDPAKYGCASDEELEREIGAIIASNPGKPMGALMGMAMARFRGKADGKAVSDMLKKLVG